MTPVAFERSLRDPEISRSLTREQLDRLNSGPPWRPLLQSGAVLATYGSLSAIGFALATWWLWPVIWLAQGVILSGFLGAAHDCAHGTMFRGRTANRVAGAFWASTVLFNFTLYKWFHLTHHRQIGTSRDTEPGGAFPSLRTYFAALPTHAFFFAFWRMSLQASRGYFPDFVHSRSARRNVIVDNWVQVTWWLLATGLTIVFPVIMLFVYWIPMIVYFPMVFLTSIPEHYGCDTSTDVWRNTRTVRSNAIFRFYFWNGNFHAEHHLLPGIPSNKLPEAHRLLGHRFLHVESSYIAFHVKLMIRLLQSRNELVPQPVQPAHRINFEYRMYRSPAKRNGP